MAGVKQFPALVSQTLVSSPVITETTPNLTRTFDTKNYVFTASVADRVAILRTRDTRTKDLSNTVADHKSEACQGVRPDCAHVRISSDSIATNCILHCKPPVRIAKAVCPLTAYPLTGTYQALGLPYKHQL